MSELTNKEIDKKLDAILAPPLPLDEVYQWSTTMWGIYATEGDGGPIALFRSKELAQSWKLFVVIGCDTVILETEAHGEFQNV